MKLETVHAMMPKRRLVRWGVALFAAAGVMATASASADVPHVPGLPDVPPVDQPFTQFTSANTSSINLALPSRQWFRLPRIRPFATTTIKQDPQNLNSLFFGTKIYFDSPRGAPEPFGYLPPFRVNNLSFGAVPAVAEVQISQLRDQNDLLIPWVATQLQEQNSDLGDAALRGKGHLTIKALSVDGVDLDLGSNGCTTAKPISIKLVGKGYAANAPKPDTSYGVVQGGPLIGTVDIPRFARCGSPNEDLSPLLTSMISGTGNPAAAFQGIQAPSCLPEGFPGAASGQVCAPVNEFPFPKDETLVLPPS